MSVCLCELSNISGVLTEVVIREGLLGGQLVQVGMLPQQGQRLPQGHLPQQAACVRPADMCTTDHKPAGIMRLQGTRS